MKNHKNQAGTMKNQPGTKKNHENRTGTMKNHKNQPGIMKNHENHPEAWKKKHEKPTWSHEKPWKPTWNHENPFRNHSTPFINFADHPGRKLSRNMRKNFLDMQKLPGWQCHDDTMVFGPLLIGLEMRECLWSCCSNQNAFIFNVDFEDMCDLKKWRRRVVDQIYIIRDGLIKHKLPRQLQTKAWIAWFRILK